MNYIYQNVIQDFLINKDKSYELDLLGCYSRLTN